MIDQQPAALEKLKNSLEAEVRDELARHSDRELMELVCEHLHNPAGTILAAVSNPGKLTTMAAVTIFRERLRRAEVAQLEAQTNA
jgi:hypothetical protein